jgi:hypothetical protein
VPLSLRCTPDEAAWLADQAAKQGLTRAAYVHYLLFGRPRPKWQGPKPSADLSAERHAATDLEAAGLELNGLARLANQSGILPRRVPHVLTRIDDLLERHHPALQKIVTAELFFQLSQIGKNLQQLRGHASRAQVKLAALETTAAQIEALVMQKVERRAAA